MKTLLLKHLQQKLSPQERTILMRAIENGSLARETVLAWEEVWQRTTLEMPLLSDEVLHAFLVEESQAKENTTTTEQTIASSSTPKIPLSKRAEYEEAAESEWRKRWKRRKSKNSWWAFALVTCFAIGLGVGLQFLGNYLNMQPKEWIQKTLSDSSKVVFTSDSRFVAPTAFKENERVIQLAGLARFSIQKSPVSFIIDAGSFRVKTNAADLIISSQDSLFVEVCAGKALVYTMYDTLARLEPKQRFNYNPKERKWEVLKQACEQ